MISWRPAQRNNAKGTSNGRRYIEICACKYSSYARDWGIGTMYTVANGREKREEKFGGMEKKTNLGIRQIKF